MAKRQRKEQPTPFVIKRKLTEVLNSDMNHPGRPLVLSGNDYPEGVKRREVLTQKPVTVVTVREQILRIQERADPLGFLISVQRGDLIPVSYVDDNGDVVTMYQQASISDRVDVARFLANKVLPSMSVTQHVMAPAPDENAAFDPNRPGQPNFAQIVAAAAARRGGGHVPVGRITEVEEDGGQTEAEPDDDSGGPAGQQGD